MKLAMLLFFMFISSSAMLDRATPYMPMLIDIFKQYWIEAPMKHIEPGKVEQESLWKEKAELKTSREYGIGLVQITQAFRKDGSVRFDNFLEAKKRYKEFLGDWQWEDRFNPKYQLTYSILTDKHNFNILSFFKNPQERWAGTLVCYNAGCGTVLNRKALCRATKGCDITKWFGGLDSVHLKSEEVLLYNKPLWIARNSYPTSVFDRSIKYKETFKGEEIWKTVNNNQPQISSSNTIKSYILRFVSKLKNLVVAVL